LLLSLLIGLPVFTLFAPDSLVGLLLPALRPTLGDTFLGFRDAARQAFDLDQGEGPQDEPTPEGTEPPPSTDGDQPSGGGSNEGNQSGGEPPTEEPTSEPSADLCANNGGVQWVGEVCVCAGVVDKVTVCNDGTKFDNVTEQTCPPDPAACQDDGSGGDQGGGGSTGDGDACKDSCGNGTCEPNCGEDSWTCSRDCGPG
jgi:hypothetical protein